MVVYLSPLKIYYHRDSASIFIFLFCDDCFFEGDSPPLMLSTNDGDTVRESSIESGDFVRRMSMRTFSLVSQ